MFKFMLTAFLAYGAVAMLAMWVKSEKNMFFFLGAIAAAECAYDIFQMVQHK